MKVVGLVSGGKDSCYNMIKCVDDGHEIVCLANLKPPVGHDELDSYMYQTVGHDAIEVIGSSSAVRLPVYLLICRFSDLR
jgi:diphthine-ammonia ligase